MIQIRQDEIGLATADLMLNVIDMGFVLCEGDPERKATSDQKCCKTN